MNTWRTIALVMLGIVACTDRQPTVPITAAAGGNGDVSVASTQPDSAHQDTTLDVVITGSGFDAGSSAQWAIAGTPATSVRTNATRFVSSKRLIANITIAADADPVLYDVIVTTGTGKKGIGTELFAVKAKQDNPQAVVEYPAADGAFKIRSDHRGEYLTADGQRYVYEAGVCGVVGQFFAFGSGDATMDPDGATITGRDKTRCGALRTVTVIFDEPADGGPLRTTPVATGGFFHVFNELWQMPLGIELEVQGGLNGAGCEVLRFKPDPGRNGIAYPGSDKLLAVRLDERTWRVRTKPFPDNKAWCAAEGRFYHLPFEVLLRVK